MARQCGKQGCYFGVFGTDRKSGIGYCLYHQYLRTDLDRRSIQQKAMEKTKLASKNGNRGTVSTGNIAKVIESEQNELEEFFEMAAKQIKKNPYCWETGDYISVVDYRSATAHIFPKSIFKSIQSHPLNFLILSPRNGAHNKTHRLDTFAKMDVFPIAIKRFLEFEPLITEKHKYLDQFKKYANDYIELHKTKPHI